MSHFLFSPAWSAYGWEEQLIATIFGKYVKSGVFSSSIMALNYQNTWHYPDTSQWSHQANWMAFVISSTVIENCHSFFPSEKPETFISTFLISSGKNI